TCASALSGCTAIVALLEGQKLYVTNVGDSRCIFSRKGQAIESLDHKPEDEAEMKRIIKAACDNVYKQFKDLPAEELPLPDLRTFTIDPAEDEFVVIAPDEICCTLSNQEVVDFVRSRIQGGGKTISQICGEHLIVNSFFDLVSIFVSNKMDVCPSEPKTDKVSTDEVGRRIICGASTMQGCRYTQEDAHSCIMEYDENTSFFAVYDGHGGHEVATYSAQHLPQYLKNSEAYKKGDYVQALKDAFLGFDATLIKPDVVAILTELASNKDGEQNSESETKMEISLQLIRNSSFRSNTFFFISDEEEEDVNKLYEEAEMPLEQVMAKYQNDLNPSEKKVKQGEGKPPGASSESGSSSSSGNDSTESDGEDEKVEVNKERESGVSSSSSEGHCSDSRQHLGNNEADQASSNGDSEPVKAASDETEAEKSKATMPESSGDAKIQTVSDNVHVKQEVNGETEEGVKTVKESEGVTSSSTPHENGEGKEKSLNEISSSAEVRKHAKLRPRIGTPLSCSSLGQGDSDSDDEEDESFQMPDN
ncbi:hypothetical protein ANN_12290, partial [Periplaneta americana]